MFDNTFNDTVGYVAPDYCDRYYSTIDRDAILALRQQRQSKLFEPIFSKYREAVQSVRDIESNWFDFSDAAIAATVEKAVTIARYTAEDPAAGLADPALLARNWSDLDLHHPPAFASPASAMRRRRIICSSTASRTRTRRVG